LPCFPATTPASRSRIANRTDAGAGRVCRRPQTARGGDRQLDMASAVEFEIHQGKITEVTVYHADTYHFDQFWAW
jgi:hypothetical protein